jgi:ammonia channel protein AmtB
MSFAASIYIRGKIAADDILNATLSGGVIVGASCSIITNPAGAIAIGMISGFTSTTGFSKLASIFTNYGIYDSVGVAHLHAIPGILGGLVSAIFIAAYNITTPEVGNARTDFAGIDYMRQGGMQILATLISIGLAIAFGLIAGLLMNCVY